jgi:hypothetical protein
MLSSLLKTERFQVNKQLLLNSGKPFSSLSDVSAYIFDLNKQFEENMEVYSYKTLSEIEFTPETFNKLNEEFLSGNLTNDPDIRTFYKIIGTKISIENSDKTDLLYANCFVSLYCPKSHLDFLYEDKKTGKNFYKTEYEVLDTDIISGLNENILSAKFIEWTNINETEDIKHTDESTLAPIIYEYFYKNNSK